MSEWQPIETAPKFYDYDILVFEPDDREQFVAFWSEGAWCYLDDGKGRREIKPTHWRPLPKPPASE